MKAHHNLGWVLRNKGRTDEAIQHYEEAIRLDPKQAGLAHFNLGEALDAKGRPDEAIQHYEEAIRLDPKVSAAAHNNLGLALRAKGRLDEAIQHYEESIRLDSKMSAMAQHNLGLALLDKGRTDEAIDHSGKPSASIPIPLSFTTTSACIARQGRTDEAIDHFRQALRLDPRFVMAQIDLGSGLYAAARAAVRAAAGQDSETRGWRAGASRQAPASDGLAARLPAV